MSGTSSINRSGYKTWRAYDPETVGNGQGGSHHKASAVQNVRAMGEDTWHVLPDRMIGLSVRGATQGLGPFIFLTAMGFYLDLAELATYPFMLLKNLADALAHMGAWFANALSGTSDGAADSETIRDYHVFAEPTYSRYFEDEGEKDWLVELIETAKVQTPPNAPRFALAPPEAKGVRTLA